MALENIEILKEDIFENQNNILKKLSNLNENVLEKHNGDINKSLENIKINGYYYEKIEEDKKAFVKYKFKIERAENAYFHIPYATKLEEAKVFINGEEILSQYSCNGNRMFVLGKHNIGDEVTIVIEQDEKEFAIQDEILYYENEEVLKKHYDILSKEQVNLKEISRRKYEGEINITSDNKYVLFTIPYDEGFEVKLDGKKVKPIKIQNMFMGVEVEEKGEHKIELEFTPKGLKTGAILSFSRNCNFCMFYIDL